MKKKLIFTLFVFFFTSIISLKAQLDSAKLFWNDTYQVGEYLKYEVRFGMLLAGEASLWVGIFPNGSDYIHHFVATAKTAGLADKMFIIRDKYESFCDMKTGLPLWAVRNIREETYLSYNEVKFNRDDNTVESLKSGIHEVPENILDILSAFYYARRHLFVDLKKEQLIEIITYFDDEIYPLRIRFKGYETVKTDYGKIDCLKFVPVVEVGRLFDDEDNMKFWITNDDKHIPVKIRVDLLVGTIKCDLIYHEGLTSELKTKKRRRK